MQALVVDKANELGLQSLDCGIILDGEKPCHCHLSGFLWLVSLRALVVAKANALNVQTLHGGPSKPCHCHLPGFLPLISLSALAVEKANKALVLQSLHGAIILVGDNSCHGDVSGFLWLVPLRALEAAKANALAVLSVHYCDPEFPTCHYYSKV